MAVLKTSAFLLVPNEWRQYFESLGSIYVCGLVDVQWVSEDFSVDDLLFPTTAALPSGTHRLLHVRGPRMVEGLFLAPSPLFPSETFNGPDSITNVMVWLRNVPNVLIMHLNTCSLELLLQKVLETLGQKVLWPLGQLCRVTAWLCSWSCLYPDVARCNELRHHAPVTDNRAT